MRIQGKKIRRNDPCICGSGVKFKRCCGTFAKIKLMNQSHKQILSEAEAKKILEEQQQGLGRPVISAAYMGYRIVAVAGTVHWSKKWLTFIDFLNEYIRYALTSEWGNRELSKEFDKRHPILQWYAAVCKQQQENVKVPGKVYTMVPNGASYSYIHLAYNLYLLAHNQPSDKFSKKLQDELITRLKKKDQFPGAYYETYVYAMLIKAGFSVELEDQTDSSTTHCECIITHRKSGKKYTVEAKSIRREGVLGVTDNYTKSDLGGSIRDQLYKSLKKSSKYPRLIFIDVNLPHEAPTNDKKLPDWMTDAVDVMNRSESNLTINRKDPDPAYVIFTNHPSHHNLSGAHTACSAIAVGFKIANFGYGTRYDSLKARYTAKQEHLDIEQLLDSMELHKEPPTTFDPELPSHKYSNEEIVPLKIGHDYYVPDGNGGEVIGTLVDAVVMEERKLVYGIYNIKNDHRVITATSPLTDEELEDFKKHPDIFFGVYRKQARKQIQDVYEGFEWLLNTYSKSSKETLLQLMKDAPNIKDLKLKDQNELALIYCEHMAPKIFANDE